MGTYTCLSGKRVLGVENPTPCCGCAGRSLVDGAVDGRQSAEPRGEPALKVSVHKPAAAGSLRL